MQYPVGMEFDPGQMRNIMDDFWAVALSPVAINKFFHAVFDGWVLAAVFVCGVSSWYLMKNRRREFALDSIRIAGWVGVVSTGGESAANETCCHGRPLRRKGRSGNHRFRHP